MSGSTYFQHPAALQAPWQFTRSKSGLPAGHVFSPAIANGSIFGNVADISSSLNTDPMWLSNPVASNTSSYVKPEEVYSAVKAESDAENSMHLQPASRKGRKSATRGTLSASADSNNDLKRSKVLAKNRQAANRYRMRQKDYVKNLERRCHREVEKRRFQTKQVQLLQLELADLENELMRQGACNCNYIRECLQSNAQKSLRGRQDDILLSSEMASEKSGGAFGADPMSYTSRAAMIA